MQPAGLNRPLEQLDSQQKFYSLQVNYSQWHTEKQVVAPLCRLFTNLGSKTWDVTYALLWYIVSWSYKQFYYQIISQAFLDLVPNISKHRVVVVVFEVN